MKFKKGLLSILIMSFIFLLSSCNNTPSYVDDNFVFIKNEDGYTLSRYEGFKFDVTIPATFNNAPITEIGPHAFSNTIVKYVTIPNNIKVINNNAFENTKTLINVTFPNTLTTIKKEAFKDCTNLNILDLPIGLITIEKDAFYNCSDLHTINIPKTLTNIDEENPFRNCHHLSNINVSEENPIYNSKDDINAIVETKTNKIIIGCSGTILNNSIKAIGHNAFIGSGINSIEIPNSVTTIGTSAFADCSNLVYIKLSSSIKVIESYTFNNCVGLNDLNIPDGIKIIQNYAFKNCKNLRNINLPNTLIKIETGVFISCLSLEHLDIPISVKTMYDSNFINCTKLEYILLPDSIIEMGNNQFTNCNTTIYTTFSSIPDTFTGDWINDDKNKIYFKDEWELDNLGIPKLK